MVAALSLAGALAAAAACIPDLPADEPPPSSGCGDGYIDLDAGEQCDPGLPLGTGGCTTNCKMQCSGLVWPQNNHCYELTSPNVTAVSTAIGMCANSTNAHVVTFASSEEFVTVAKYVDGIDAGPFWIGLQGGLTLTQPTQEPEPGWVPTCPGCYAHSLDETAPLPRVDASLPDGAPVREACVAGFSDVQIGTWEQYPCAGSGGYTPPRLHVVCEREPAGRQSRECDGSICLELVLTHGAERYVYVPVPATADQAAQACKALGGELVVLRSRDEREQLWSQLSRLAAIPSSFWIGLSLQDGATDGGDGGPPVWVWDDGTPAEDYPPPWGSATLPDAGMQTRAFLWQRGTTFADDTLAHNDQPALTTMPYVCELHVGDAAP